MGNLIHQSNPWLELLDRPLLIVGNVQFKYNVLVVTLVGTKNGAWYNCNVRSFLEVYRFHLFGTISRLFAMLVKLKQCGTFSVEWLKCMNALCCVRGMRSATASFSSNFLHVLRHHQLHRIPGFRIISMDKALLIYQKFTTHCTPHLISFS